MKLSKFSIGDFGNLHSLERAFAPRLTVVFGRNESGKTTLLHFIRRTLFLQKGLKDDPYQPLGSSKASGHLLLSMSEGRGLRVEFDGRKQWMGDSDGVSMEVMKEDFLPLKSGLFNRIFAIELDDIQSLSTLSDEEIRNRFFAAESGLGTVSFSKFMTDMDEAEKRLYVPAVNTSSGPLLNAILTELAENESKIEALKIQNREYITLTDNLNKALVDLSEAKDRLRKNCRRLGVLEVLSQARPIWFEIQELEMNLGSLGPVRKKVQGGIERLNTLLQNAANLQESLSEQKRKRDYEERCQKTLKNRPETSLVPHREVLENLESEMERINRAEEDLSYLTVEISEREEGLKRELRNFAPHWNEENLRASDIALNIEETAKNFEESFDTLLKRKDDCLHRAEVETSRLGILKSEAESMREDLEKLESVIPEDLQARRDLFIEIRRGLLRNDELFREIRTEKMRAEILSEEMRIEREPPVPRKNYVTKIVLAFSLFFSGLTLALIFLEPNLQPLYYAALGSVAFSSFLTFSLFRSRRYHTRRLSAWTGRCTRRKQALAALEEKIDARREEIQRNVAVIEQRAQSLDIRVPSTVDDLDSVSELIEDERSQTRNLGEKKSEGKRLLRLIEESARQKMQCDEELKTVEMEIEETLRNWQTWLSQNRFDTNLTPGRFPSFIAGARNARKDLQELDTLRARLTHQLEYMDRIKARVQGLGSAIGEDLPAAFRSLKEGLELQARLDASMDVQRSLDFEIERLKENLSTTLKDVHSLFEEAGVGGEMDFRALIEECEYREQLEARLAEQRRLLAGIMGKTDKELWESEFLGDALAQAAEMEELRFDIAGQEKALAELDSACETMKEQAKLMASEDHLFELRQKNEFLHSRKKDTFKHWLAVVLAKHLASKARERHEKAHQPEVIKEAHRILALMAPEKWKLVADMGSDFSAVLEHGSGGLRLEENQWSSGLADQVYLSLRLAMACYWAKQSEPIPVILDDVLVRFDEERQQGAMRALWQISEQLQVVLFTCSRFTADLFHSALSKEKEFSLIEMPSNEENEKKESGEKKTPPQKKASPRKRTKR